MVHKKTETGFKQSRLVLNQAVRQAGPLELESELRFKKISMTVTHIYISPMKIPPYRCHNNRRRISGFVPFNIVFGLLEQACDASHKYPQNPRNYKQATPRTWPPSPCCGR
jgi:hypothetical protein